MRENTTTARPDATPRPAPTGEDWAEEALLQAPRFTRPGGSPLPQIVDAHVTLNKTLVLHVKDGEKRYTKRFDLKREGAGLFCSFPGGLLLFYREFKGWGAPPAERRRREAGAFTGWATPEVLAHVERLQQQHGNLPFLRSVREKQAQH